MKVLFISSWYPTPNNPNYGVFIQEHAKAINSTDVELVVLPVVIEQSKSFFKITVRDYNDSGFRTVEVLISTRFRDLVYHFVPLQNVIALVVLKKCVFPSFKPDIVHSNVVFPAGMMGEFVSKRLNVPHVITEHWSKIASILRKPYLGGLARKAYLNAARILPVSDFLKCNMLSLMPELNADKFSIISNVINADTFTYKPKVTNPNEVTFCAIATWATKKEPDKKPELFIDALANLQAKTEKKFKLIMVGGGNRVEELKKYCQNRNVNAHFVGYQSKNSIAQILHSSDFFIHASTVETFGVVTVEALMTGTPVICSNVGALPELVNESNGLLCENTVESWVESIKQVLKSEFDCKQIASDVEVAYNTKNIGRKIYAVYKELIG